MRALRRNDLVLLNLLVIVLLLTIAFLPSSVLRIILGVPFVLFFPGYALMAALYPGRERLDSTQRLALSLGLSIVVVSLAGVALNYTPWGITLESVLYSNAAFMLMASVVAWVRRRNLQAEARPGGGFQLRVPGWSGGAWDRALTVVLTLAVMAAVATAGYVVAKPRLGESFTEFYVLGADGMTADYPDEVVVGDTREVTVGIVNREHETVSYRLVVTLGGVEIGGSGPIVLENEEKWERPVSFTATAAGDDQELEFLLYRDGEAEPHLGPLRLWIDVTE